MAERRRKYAYVCGAAAWASAVAAGRELRAVSGRPGARGGCGLWPAPRPESSTVIRSPPSAPLKGTPYFSAEALPYFTCRDCSNCETSMIRISRSDLRLQL